jgi:splicing factor 1
MLINFIKSNETNLTAMERETGAKIIIRGKGSVKEGKVGRKDGQPLPGEDEPLHAYVTANNPESVKKAVDQVKRRIILTNDQN